MDKGGKDYGQLFGATRKVVHESLTEKEGDLKERNSYQTTQADLIRMING